MSATTGSGQHCRFKLHVIVVHRPLMSVSRICDAGHRVVFEANGGYIQSVATREKVQFRRDNKVYRLGVSVPTGFSLAVSAIPVSPSHELFANEDDDREDSERDVVFESQEKAEDEAQKAVGIRDPGAPTSAEVAEHELTHLPHRSWCVACVSGRARDRQHRRLDGREQLEVPCVVFDYGFFGGEGDEETLVVQIAKDVRTKMLFAPASRS